MATTATKSKAKIVVVDSGKHRTKAVSYEDGKVTGRFDVKTVSNDTVETVSRNRSTYIVTLHNKSTLIGGLAGSFNFETSKSQEVHRRATYLALSKLAKNKDHIILSIGCPLSVWFNPNHRENYMRFMLDLPEDSKRDPNEGDFNLEFEVDGEKFQFTIDHLLVFPETSGYLIKNEEKYENRTVAVVDIGGLNVNGVIYQPNGEFNTLEPNEATFFTINQGGNVFLTELAKGIKSAFGVEINDYQMPEVYQKGFIKSHKEESAKFIQDFTDEYLENIRQKMKAHGWSVETLDFIFVGGGSLMFKEHILAIPVFSDAEISDNAVWDNAEGFAVATEVVFAE